MTKVLILTAGFGEGHNAAARNLKAAFDDILGPGSAELHDLFAESSPRINAISRRFYLWLINKMPRVWSAFYAHIDKYPPFPRHLWFLRKECATLQRLVKEHKHDLICSTFPAYAFMAERLSAKGEPVPPFCNIVTDSISIHTLWTRPRCAAWFVPNEETVSALLAQGVPQNKIHPCGFPVQLYFAREGLDLQPPDLSSSRPRILYMLHSGLQNAAATAARLIRETDYELTFAVGRDERLRSHLEDLARGRKVPVTILSWTDQIPRLLLTHHVVISKAGGATTQEAIAARCPMIVNQVVPGQEEGNYELLRRRGIGQKAENPGEILEALHRAFSDNAAEWNRWRRELKNLARQNASVETARAALRYAEYTELGK